MGPDQGDFAGRGEGLGFDSGLNWPLGGFAQGGEKDLHLNRISLAAVWRMY